MIFFRRKKEEEKTKDIEEIKRVVEEEKPSEEKVTEIEEKPEETPTVEKPEEEKPKFAPLFVKIDRYRTVLNLLNDLKTTIMMVKNAIVIQKEIEKLTNDNRNLIESAVSKLDEKLSSLDSEFMRPKGFREEFPTVHEEKVGLKGVVDDLKVQVESLKSELKSIS